MSRNAVAGAGRRPARRRINWSPYLFLAPFMISFIVFTILPILMAVILSFTSFNGVGVPTFAFLDNYERMLVDDEVLVKAIANTLLFAFITGPVGYILSILLAWLVNELGRRTRTVLTLIFYAPSIALSALSIWLYIFSADSYGLVNSLLIQLGVIVEPVAWLINPQTNVWVVIFIQLWLSMGSGFLAFVAGFQTIDRSMYEAGALDGIHNRFQELWYLTLPSIRPQLMFGAVMQIGATFAISDVPMQLTGFPSTNNSTTTWVTHILDVGTVRMEMGYACALATVLFIVMIITRNIVALVIKGEE